jgi:signal transduction histidine kinase
MPFLTHLCISATVATRSVHLSTKLAIALTLMATLVLGSYGGVQLWREDRDLRNAADRDFRLLCRAVQVSVEHFIREGHETSVRAMLDSLEREDAGVGVHVFDAAGRLTADSWGSNETTELARQSVRRAGGSAQPLVYFEGPRGLSHLVGVFRLRAEDGSSLGAVAVVRPLDELRRDLTSETISTIAQILTLLAGIVGVIWVLVSIHVRRPLVDLIAAMRTVRDGELGGGVPVHRRDELGEVAAEFNSMVGDLAEARNELIAAADARAALEAGLLRVDKLVTVGQLSAGLAHEIGSPLQILNGRALALAARTDLPSEVIWSARIVAEQSDRIARIVERLLAFARRQPADMGEIDIGSAIRAVVDLIEPEARRRGVQTDFECADALPRVVADADGVQQVALNLLTNALRATPRGGRVRLAMTTSSFKVEQGSRERPSVSFVVEDTGGGIPDEVRRRIFEPFFTTWTDLGGTGLGLTVVKSIVDQHGGAILVSSARGSGTRFTVHFPLADVAAATGVVA